MKTNASLRIFKLAALTTIIVWGLSVRSAQATFIITMNQVGSDVVATGSGTIDLTGLSFFLTALAGAQVQPNDALIVTGPVTAGSYDFYTGITGPTSFGSGNNNTPASSGSGDLFVLNGTFPFGAGLGVPSGYVSGTALSSTATWNGETFASLGMTPGTYEWTWGTAPTIRGPNAASITLNVVAPAVPETGSTFGLLVLALAALFGASRLGLFG